MFSLAEESELRQVTELYGKVKELILFCEENHEEFKSNLHEVKELRDAFDHLMRIFAARLGVKDEKDDRYVKENMDKVFGHVYRAGYDTLDYATLILRDKINSEVLGFSPSAIQAAIPTYYSEIRPSVESITSDIIKLRNDKDVANKSPEVFTVYFQNVKNLQKMFDAILKAKPSLIEYSDKRKKEQLNDTLTKIAIGIAIGVIMALIGRIFL